MKRRRSSDLMALLLGAIGGYTLREYNNTTAPSDSITDEPEDADSEEKPGKSPLSPPPGSRILLIEDDIEFASVLVRMLVTLGHTVAGPLARLDDAVDAAQQESVDLAVLDVDLHGKATSSVAEMLDARHIPFVVMTGYSADELSSPFRNRPTLQKPFRQRDLLVALEAARSSGSSDALPPLC
jgi:CheY-like chemotaxis protein